LFSGNDGDAGREWCQPTYVIAVAVRQDDGGYRLWSDFGDVLQEFFSPAGVVFASMTMTPLSPTITPLFPPPPSTH
jgi:hypothetical protein